MCVLFSQKNGNVTVCVCERVQRRAHRVVRRAWNGGNTHLHSKKTTKINAEQSAGHTISSSCGMQGGGGRVRIGWMGVLRFRCQTTFSVQQQRLGGPEDMSGASHTRLPKSGRARGRPGKQEHAAHGKPRAPHPQSKSDDRSFRSLVVQRVQRGGKGQTQARGSCTDSRPAAVGSSPKRLPPLAGEMQQGRQTAALRAAPTRKG